MVERGPAGWKLALQDDMLPLVQTVQQLQPVATSVLCQRINGLRHPSSPSPAILAELDPLQVAPLSQVNECWVLILSSGESSRV